MNMGISKCVMAATIYSQRNKLNDGFTMQLTAILVEAISIACDTWQMYKIDEFAIGGNERAFIPSLPSPSVHLILWKYILWAENLCHWCLCFIRLSRLLIYIIHNTSDCNVCCHKMNGGITRNKSIFNQTDENGNHMRESILLFQFL